MHWNFYCTERFFSEMNCLFPKFVCNHCLSQSIAIVCEFDSNSMMESIQFIYEFIRIFNVYIFEWKVVQWSTSEKNSEGPYIYYVRDLGGRGFKKWESLWQKRGIIIISNIRLGIIHLWHPKFRKEGGLKFCDTLY